MCHEYLGACLLRTILLTLSSFFILLQDFHDDGEGGAGIKIMHLLRDSNVRNVVVIVSRWFGGMLLGPARFMYITDAARGVLNQGGYLKQAQPLAIVSADPGAEPMEEDSSSSEEEAEVGNAATDAHAFCDLEAWTSQQQC